MNRPGLVRILAIFCAWIFALGALAQDTRTDGDPVYKPPLRGAPASRVGGGSRGIGTEMPRLYALAPQDIGFTTKAKPDLFWFASDASEAKVKLQIYTDDPAKPLLEQALAGVAAPGVQRVKLSNFALELQPRTEYHWRITMTNESEARSARAVAGGTIQRTNAWPKLDTRLQNGDNVARAHVYAEEGLWYDAIEMLSNSIDADPANTGVRKQRASLLQQVGLTEPSQFETGKK